MNTQVGYDRSPIVTERVLDGLPVSLFIQAPQNQHEFVRRLVTNEGLGVVYSLNSQRRQRNARTEMQAIVEYTRCAAPDASILIDANQYSGKNRKFAGDGLSETWIDEQLRIGKLPYALTDSGYIGRGDKAGLETILKASSNLKGRVVTVLPLAWQWLTEDINYLSERLENFGRPVAVALEHESDPMGQKGTAAGLTLLLSTGIPVFMLRCDTSALGALAYGASGVAVGTESGLRHIYPTVHRRGGVAPPPSALVPGLLGYYHLEKLGDAIQQNPNLKLWQCPCSHCLDRRLDWFRFSSAPRDDAFAHSLASLASIGRTITTTIESERPQLWTTMCQDAQIQHFSVLAGNDGDSWEPKKALANWVSATPTRVGEW